MATIKGFSVARTEKGFGTAVASSTVYSLSPGVPGAAQTGRNGSYDHPTDQGLTEGRVKTLLVNGQTLTGATATTPFSSQTTAGTARTDLASTEVVATTTTISATNDDASGLIVRFTTTAGGAIPAVANVTAVDTGNRYTDGDTVEVDGWEGSVFVVDAA